MLEKIKQEIVVIIISVCSMIITAISTLYGVYLTNEYNSTIEEKKFKREITSEKIENLKKLYSMIEEQNTFFMDAIALYTMEKDLIGVKDFMIKFDSKKNDIFSFIHLNINIYEINDVYSKYSYEHFKILFNIVKNDEYDSLEMNNNDTYSILINMISKKKTEFEKLLF